MQRRLFALMLGLSPFAALAPASAEQAATHHRARRRLAEKSWDQLTPRQRARMLHGFGAPAPSAEEARSRWDGMDQHQRRAVARAAGRGRRQG